MTLRDTIGLRTKAGWRGRLELVRLILWVVVFVCVPIGFFCVHFQAPPLLPLIGHDDWIIVSGFYENSKPDSPDMDATILKSVEARFFRSWKPDGGSVVGATLESRPFQAADVLVVPFVGYPIESGVHLDSQRKARPARQQP